MGKRSRRFSRGLQIKILTIFAIAFLAVLAAGYLVRKNSQEVNQTLASLSKPDKDQLRLRYLLAYLSEAENSLRIYALTSDQEYFNIYNYLIMEVENSLDTLRSSASYMNDSRSSLDSVSALLGRRRNIINQYLTVREQLASFNFATEAYSQIKRAPPDSAVNVVRTSISVITTYDTIARGIDYNKQSPELRTQGFFNKVKKLFSKKVENERLMTPTEPIILSRTQIISDSAMEKHADTTIFRKVRKALTNVGRKEQARYDQLKEQELNMLRNSSLIIDQVMTIFRKIETRHLHSNQLRTEKATQEASRSIFILGSISLASLMLILIFIYMVLRGLRQNNQYRMELIKATRQSMDLARVKEEFLANMSHEIRTPLSAIIGFSEQLIHTPLNNIQKEYLGAVRRSSNHLLETVNDILDLSKLGAGKVKIESTPFRIKDILEDVISTFGMSASEKGLEFEASCNAGSNLKLMGDPLRLRQILYNLLSNAIKFTEKGSINISCSIEQEDDHCLAVIAVRDTGTGIAIEEQSAIFEDFRQAESSSSRRYGGTGLGLAISRRLARLQNGNITVESTPGKGSVFTVQIPYTITDSEPAAAETGTQLKNINLEGRSLLLVDDDVFNILLARIIAENHGMLVDIASNGRQAIDLINTNRYEIIMTDVQMPEVSGFELVKMIRNQPDRSVALVPVIAFTASKIDRYEPGYMDAGFNEVLQKPFSEVAFLRCMASHLTNPLTELAEPSPKHDNKLPYDLSEAAKFSGDNAAQMAGIIRSFIQTSQAAVKELWTFYDDGNIRGIKLLAHKLLTSYGHMGIDEAIPVLSTLENLDENTPRSEEVKAHIRTITSITTNLYPLLEKELLKNQ
ncbi:MAG: ATP-binding protein [Lentimicrobium sp.]|jgi:signal transduction histidine kinase/FixJ family two-component response regulator|nr:ATP-binding protein [Lentimicrobium sp.]